MQFCRLVLLVIPIAAFAACTNLSDKMALKRSPGDTGADNLFYQCSIDDLIPSAELVRLYRKHIVTIFAPPPDAHVLTDRVVLRDCVDAWVMFNDMDLPEGEIVFDGTYHLRFNKETLKLTGWEL